MRASNARLSEWKLDGIRIQVHRRGDEIRIYTRNLNEITEMLPGIATAARLLPVTQAAVRVRPQLVVEIALDGVQFSTRYPGGVALRFARVKRYRPDKSAAEADTIDDLRALLGRSLQPGPAP